MWIKIVYLLYFIAQIIDAQSTETTVDQSPIACLNETDCDASDNRNDLPTTPETVSEVSSKSNNSSINNAMSSTTEPTITRPQNRVGNCDCDLTISSCDVNCCCDVDCKDSDVKGLFICKDDRTKLYDNRYCYNNDDKKYNRSRYLLEKLRDNLFCIVEDNLPPVYTTDYDPIISNRSTLEEIVNNNQKSRFKWEQSAIHNPPQFTSNEPYRYGDIIWKMQNNYVKKLEIPQTGFTSICSFKKALKYLEDWKHSCMQILLDNTNSHLFFKTFTNFTIVASPVLYNDSFFTSDNQSCPKNICVPVESHYCSDSWNLCKNETTPLPNCRNGTCYNIVRGVRLVITHSGIKGIRGINVYLKIGNASEKFYQDFEVKYKWLEDDETKIFHLSGSQGYIVGKPIIIGNLVTDKTNDKENSHVSVDKEDYFLSLPVSKFDGRCNKDARYEVKFGEDLKLSCKIELTTRNFTTNSCIDLQNQIFKALFKTIRFNDTDVDKHSTLVAKWNHLDKNETNNWVKILFDRIPQNIVTAQIIDDQLMCSGLVTSLRIDIVHRHLPEPQTIDNYKILGVAITFSEDSDIYWDKCNNENCAEVLIIDVISYVIFHDVSKPSKYFYAEGPNLDISLPHDFFYPFINHSASLNSGESHALIFILISIIIHKLS